jgi:predicted kinase
MAGSPTVETNSAMEAVILIGIQGSGKSSFYKARFADTHVRINLDMLKTRHRENLFFETCLAAKQRFVVDNCNLSRDDRRRYIEAAKAAGFMVLGYYLQSRIDDCKKRNEQRTENQVVPIKAILGAAGRLELPTYEERFDKLFYVRLDGNGRFIVEDWKQ